MPESLGEVGDFPESPGCLQKKWARPGRPPDRQLRFSAHFVPCSWSVLRFGKSENCLRQFWTFWRIVRKWASIFHQVWQSPRPPEENKGQLKIWLNFNIAGLVSWIFVFGNCVVYCSQPRVAPSPSLPLALLSPAVNTLPAVCGGCSISLMRQVCSVQTGRGLQ